MTSKNNREIYCPAGCIIDLSTLDHHDLCLGEDGLTYCRPCFELDREAEHVEARARRLQEFAEQARREANEALRHKERLQELARRATLNELREMVRRNRREN